MMPSPPGMAAVARTMQEEDVYKPLKEEVAAQLYVHFSKSSLPVSVRQEASLSQCTRTVLLLPAASCELRLPGMPLANSCMVAGRWVGAWPCAHIRTGALEWGDHHRC